MRKIKQELRTICHCERSEAIPSRLPRLLRSLAMTLKHVSPAKRLLSCFLITNCLLLITPATTYAQEPEAWPSRCQSEGVATIQGFECIFTNIVRILTPLAGLLLFIMLVVGSFQLLTAGGDPKQIQKAQKTLTAAIGGIVLFFGIWFILLLIKQITGVDVTRFEIPGPQ